MSVVTMAGAQAITNQWAPVRSATGVAYMTWLVR
jgi:hypothetical protein